MEFACPAAIELSCSPMSVDVTFAFFKPDVVRRGKEHVANILAQVQAAGFDVVAQKQFTMTESLANVFYGEHIGRPFYPALMHYMTSGPAIGFILCKKGDDSIKAWRTLIGPTNTQQAKAEQPQSLRAKYGTDATQNGFHGSDSPASVAREIGLVFPDVRVTIATPMRSAL